jgi:hypothetical protein
MTNNTCKEIKAEYQLKFTEGNTAIFQIFYTKWYALQRFKEYSEANSLYYMNNPSPNAEGDLEWVAFDQYGNEKIILTQKNHEI